MKVLKSWCNGWATSRRYHDNKLLPCLFGCSHRSDELEHYVLCPHLHALWSFLDGSRDINPLVRWGLITPQASKLKYVCCAFSGYHAVRREFRKSSQHFVDHQDVLTGAQLRTSWSVFASTFHMEAGEFSVHCRKFSLPSFLVHLHAIDARINSEPSFLNDE